MNYNKEIINRALEKAGQESLTEADIEKDSTRWRLIKSLYLPTLLETLSKTTWTSQTKRAPLTLSEETNYTTYEYMYNLPHDCAKPEQICNDEEYMVEGNYLYTDKEDAVLVYITNGKTEIPVNLVESKEEITDENFDDNPLYIKDEEDNYILATSFEEGETYYKSYDDYPHFKEIDFEADPMLALYIETRLAAKITLKITGNTQIYQMLFAESLEAEQNAIKTTQTHSHSKENGNKYWWEQAGIDSANN